MRVIHLTSVHRYDDTRIFIRMCSSLAAAGYDVHLIAPREDTNKIEHRNGVSIHPVPVPSNRFQRMTDTVQAALHLGAGLNGDIYHFHDPEFLRYIPGWQKRLRRPFVYDIHEDYRVKMREKDWVPQFLRTSAEWIFGKIEDNAVAQIAAVVAATPNIATRFNSHPFVQTICNYPLRDELFVRDKSARRELGLFAYIGSISYLRGAKEMVRALSVADPPANLAMAGSFSPETLRKELASQKGWAAVRYLGVLDRVRLKSLLAKAYAGLVLLHPTRAYSVAYPVKLFEYMAAGLPVIASDFPLWRSFVRDSGCGLLVNPLDCFAIAAAMNWLIQHPVQAEDMGKAGRAAVLGKYNWESEFPKLISLYESVNAKYKV